MKKILLLIILLLCRFVSYADYTDSVTTNSNELEFTTQNGYDIVTINNGYYTKEISEPQLPVKIFRFVVPIDKKVKNIVISWRSFVTSADKNVVCNYIKALELKLLIYRKFFI
jgi:hypothetical protein